MVKCTAIDTSVSRKELFSSLSQIIQERNAFYALLVIRVEKLRKMSSYFREASDDRWQGPVMFSGSSCC